GINSNEPFKLVLFSDRSATVPLFFFIVFHFSRIIRELVSIELGKKAHDIPFTEQERDGIKQLPDSCFFSRMFERSLRKILGLRFQIAAAISGHMKAQALVFTTATRGIKTCKYRFGPVEIPPLIYDSSYGPTCIEGSLNTIYIVLIKTQSLVICIDHDKYHFNLK
ncbi:hypothetical protein ACJX0J_003900, partial (mitochondrion) [Zea mays]